MLPKQDLEWVGGEFEVGGEVYIFVKHVISIKFATYRLETCDFVRQCFAKISHRKFSNNLRRVAVENPY